MIEKVRIKGNDVRNRRMGRNDLAAVTAHHFDELQDQPDEQDQRAFDETGRNSGATRSNGTPRGDYSSVPPG